MLHLSSFKTTADICRYMQYCCQRCRILQPKVNVQRMCADGIVCTIQGVYMLCDGQVSEDRQLLVLYMHTLEKNCTAVSHELISRHLQI